MENKGAVLGTQDVKRSTCAGMPTNAGFVPGQSMRLQAAGWAMSSLYSSATWNSLQGAGMYLCKRCLQITSLRSAGAGAASWATTCACLYPWGSAGGCRQGHTQPVLLCHLVQLQERDNCCSAPGGQFTPNWVMQQDF